MVAVEAANIVRGEGAAGRARFEIKEPDKPTIAGINRIKAAFPTCSVIHVHTKEDLSGGDDGGGLDLIPLTCEPTQSGWIHASRARGKAPELRSGTRLKRIDRLTGSEVDPLLAADSSHL